MIKTVGKTFPSAFLGIQCIMEANDIQRIIDRAKERGYDPDELVVGEGLLEQAKQATEKLGITIPIRVARPQHLALMNDYLKQPFKDATIGDYWHTFDRRTRREIERLVKNGKNPDIMKYC